MSGLDLSYLSQDEVIHIKEVLASAKVVLHVDGGNAGTQKRESQKVKSDELIQSLWKERHSAAEYFSGSDMVIAALPEVESSTPFDETTERQDLIPETTTAEENSSHIFQAVLNNIIDEIEKKITENAQNKDDQENVPLESTVFVEGRENEEKSPVKRERKESWLLKKIKRKRDGSRKKSRLSSEDSSDAKVEECLSSTSSEIRSDTTTDTPHSPDIVVLTEDTTGADQQIDVSESEQHSTSQGGILDISLTYFPPEHKLNTQCASNKSRLSMENMHVMARKDYVLLTGAKLSILKGTESGAKEEDDAELHIEVHGARDITLNASVVKNKSRTYVKCYMIPDRFHAAKMRSSVVKENNSPNYSHKFVYRGFNKAEFEDRCIEVLVCGLSFTIGKTVVVGGIRLSSRDEAIDPKLGASEKELILWKRAFDNPTEEVKGSLPLRPNMKPAYY